jgi:hypothetical protein
MQTSLSFNVNGMGFVFGVEVPEGMPFTIDHDVCAKPSSSHGHAEKTASVVTLCGSPVLSINCLGNVSEICKCVVPHISVDVVNCVFWPIAGYVEPRKTMCEIAPPMKFDNASVFVCAASDATNGDSGALDKPSEYAGLMVVFEQFAQLLRGKIGLSHEAVLSLIGQRPAAIRRRLRASLL